MIYGDNIREPDLLRRKLEGVQFRKKTEVVFLIFHLEILKIKHVTFLWGISKKLEVDSL